MFDLGSLEERFDQRTGMFRPGTRTPPTRAVHEIIDSVSMDLEILFREMEWDWDGTEERLLGQADTMVWLLQDPRMTGSRIDEAAADILKKMIELVDSHTPIFTYYGPHKRDGGNIGVWLDWPRIEEAEEKGDLIRIRAEYGVKFVLVDNKDGVKHVFNAATGETLKWDETFVTKDVVANIEKKAKYLLVENAEFNVVTCWATVDAHFKDLVFQA